MSEELRDFIDSLVRAINKKIPMKQYKERYSPGEDRTLLFVVRGKEKEYGFAMLTDKLITMRKIENPTVAVSCTEDTFWKLAAKKITVDWAMATRKLHVAGTYFLRDYIILRNFFDEVYDKMLGG